MSATVEIPVTRSNLLVLFPLLLPFAAFWKLIPGLTPFSEMCGIALTLYLLIKLHTLAHFLNGGSNAERRGDFLTWFLAWPGLDASAFFSRNRVPPHPIHRRDWLVATLKIAIGIVLCVVVAPRLLPVHATLAGWTVLTGIALCVHFGAFHVLALGWQRQGRGVTPIMQAPVRSTSLVEFWSRRWNLAFRDYAHFAFFVPLTRRVSPGCALLFGYLCSGLIHELAISVPADQGYGLPTAYFGLQGCGVLTERWLHRHLTFLGTTVCGWLWTMTVTVGPACLLFHEGFLDRVVLPLLSPFAS